MVIQNENIRNLLKRGGFLLLTIAVYCLGNAIPLPFPGIISRFNNVIVNSPLGLLSLMGGSNYNQITLFSVGINPLMISMILIQVLQMTGFLGFDALSPSQVNRFRQVLTLIFAAVQSYAVVWGLQLLPHSQKLQIAAAVLMMSAGAMLISWLGSMNSQKGICGIVVLFLINISAGMLPRLQKAVHLVLKSDHPHFYLGALLVLAILIVVFWIAFSYAYYPLNLININFPSYSKAQILPIGLNIGAMMMYMMGMAIIMLPTVAGHIFKIKWLTNPVFSTIFTSVTGVILFYFFSFMQFSPRQQAKSMRNENNYILGVRPGLPTQRYLRKRLFFCCIPGAILNTVQLVFGIAGVQYFGKVGVIASIPMVAVMMVMFMVGIKDSILTLLIPYKYDQMIKKEG